MARYWWVNQNQTYQAEVAGGYLWSPKRIRNGARNQFYENMREVAPGDQIFSFRDTLIPAIGIAQSFCYDAPKPEEFGRIGVNWSDSGWKIDVSYAALRSPISPKDHIEQLRPHLPGKYSPLQKNGDGLQGVYLAEVPNQLAAVLDELIRSAGNELPLPDSRVASLPTGRRDELIEDVEEVLEQQIAQSTEIPDTEIAQVIKARRGQGRFRQNVQRFEKCCRVTGISNPQFLIASHIKPWRSSSNPERLDGENGLLLSPAIDFLFDRGFISFSDHGFVLISPIADAACLKSMGISDGAHACGMFTERQQHYLSYHRKNVFLQAGMD